MGKGLIEELLKYIWLFYFYQKIKLHIHMFIISFFVDSSILSRFVKQKSKCMHGTDP